MKKNFFNYFTKFSREIANLECKKTKVTTSEIVPVSQISYLVLKNNCVR